MPENLSQPVQEPTQPISPPQPEIKEEITSLGIIPPSNKSKKLQISLGILGLVFILTSIPVAIYLVKQRQEIREKAAPSGTVIENDKFKVTVVDVGPGNYDSQVCAWPEGSTDARSLPGDSLTQIFTIENKTATNYKLTLISYPYKIYSIYYPDEGGCIDAYTEEEINLFVTQSGGNLNEAYRQFAEKLLDSIRHVTDKCGAHIYDNGPIPPYDPSSIQPRILTSPGGLNCSQLGGLVPENTYSDSQTHIGSNYISAGLVTLSPHQTVTNQSFTFYQSVCGFYQWDHGFLVENLDNPGEAPWVMWVGSELKLFPCPTPTQVLSCTDLAGTPDPSGLSPQDKIALTCTGTSDPDPINHFEFTVSIDGGTPTSLSKNASATKTDSKYKGTINYTIPDYGCYKIECRACVSADSSNCTVWGQAGKSLTK